MVLERPSHTHDEHVFYGCQNYSLHLTDSTFSTKITLGNDYLEPKIIWEGKLPQTIQEAEAFLLKNNILV